jgi:hypothetical protein
MGEMFADDVAAGGAKYVADKKNIHQLSLHLGVVVFARRGARRVGVVAFGHGTECAVCIEFAGVGSAGG